jgi:hypothetical protein
MVFLFSSHMQHYQPIHMLIEQIVLMIEIRLGLLYLFGL